MFIKTLFLFFLYYPPYHLTNSLLLFFCNKSDNLCLNILLVVNSYFDNVDILTTILKITIKYLLAHVAFLNIGLYNCLK